MHWRRISGIITETYADFALNSSIHGLKYTGDKKMSLLERAFWIATLLLGLFGSSQMLLIFWKRYTSHPTRTTYETFSAPLDEIPFPATSICTETAVMKSKLRRILSKIDLNGYSNEEIENAVLELFERYEFNVNKTALTVLDEVLYKNNISKVTEFIHSIIPDCSDFLIKCQWESKDFDCASHFLSTYREHRRCCVFANRYASESVFAFPKPFFNLYTQNNMGLTVVIKFLWDDSIPEHDSSAKIFIYENVDRNIRRSVVTRIVPEIILDLPFSAVITESTEDVRLLKYEQRHCYFIDERTNGPFKFYSEATCKVASKWKESMDKCGCIPLFSTTISDETVCNNVTLFPCTLYLEWEPILDECKRTCNNVDYAVLETATPLMMNKTFVINPFYESFNITPLTSVLYVHHENDFQTKYATQTITSTSYLLYSLGGVFGLFLGCSFISLAEIFYYIFLRLPININRLRKAESWTKQPKHQLYLSDFKTNESAISKSIKVKYRKEAFILQK